MTTGTTRGPQTDQPESGLLPHGQEELDALIKEARRRARRRRAGYAAATALAVLIITGVALSVGGGGTSPRAASSGGGAEAAKTSIGGQPRFDPQSVSFVSPTTGWAWGPGVRWLERGWGPGVLSQTNDAGRHWSVIPTPGIDYAQMSSDPFGWASGVRFVNRRQGYLFGGELWATADGGHHWTRLHPPNEVWDMEVGAGRAYAVIAGCRGLAACTEAHLYRLRNGGRSFVRIGPSSPIGAGRLVVRGASVYLLAPQPAYRDVIPIPLWVSANGGRSWERHPTPCHGEVDWDALAAWSLSGLVLACGDEPGASFQEKTFYVSTDGGVHWRLAGKVPGAPRLHGMSFGYIASLAAVSKDTWVLGEARGTILVTHDRGRTWRAAAFTGKLGPVEGWGDLDFTDASDGVAVPWTLNGSVLAFTNNAGLSWREVGFPSPRSG